MSRWTTAPTSRRAYKSANENEDDFVWVGLFEPTEEEMSKVADTFDLHPLAVEDAVRAHQRPKLERYREAIFMVLKTIWYVDEEDAVETGEIAVFVGSNYVVTVRHGEGAELGVTRRDLEQHTEVLGHGPVRRAVLRLRPGRRRLRGGGGGPRDRRRRDRAVGLLRQPQQRLRSASTP